MRQEQERVLKQIVTLDPDLVVITPPCGPWNCLQAANDQDVCHVETFDVVSSGSSAVW